MVNEGIPRKIPEERRGGAKKNPVFVSLFPKKTEDQEIINFLSSRNTECRKPSDLSQKEILVQKQEMHDTYVAMNSYLLANLFREKLKESETYSQSFFIKENGELDFGMRKEYPENELISSSGGLKSEKDLINLLTKVQEQNNDLKIFIYNITSGNNRKTITYIVSKRENIEQKVPSVRRINNK